MEKLLAALRKFDALRDRSDGSDGGRVDEVLVRMLPRQEPQYASPNYMNKFPDFVRKGFQDFGVNALYSHQAQAIDLILEGADVVLEAPTASGKTLCFNIPLVLTLLDNPGSHALMIHPMKALSNDQRRQFNDLARAISGGGDRRLQSWIFDGDLDREHRRIIKADPPAVLFTNPEMLHLSFLGWCDQWISFLSKLKVVVLDEIHEYRGYFGTNVALLLRRFFAKLNKLGAQPQIVLATATCGNAEEHAYRLTGRKCSLVRATEAMRPERHFAFINPDIPDYRFLEIYLLRIVRATLACLDLGLSTLIFCPSRKFAEEAAIRARREAKEYGIDPETIAPYRSGYEAELRRKIEEGLRSGSYEAVFSTNALEIGVDIGRLDVCILAGFPDNVLSAWQRIGRVGRSWEKNAYILFYALNNPFDRFFARNIGAFSNKPLDEILISIDNEELMDRHLKFLNYECGSDFNDPALVKILGEKFFGFARERISGKRPLLEYSPPYPRLDIRGNSGAIYRLIYKEKEIGTISDRHLFREAYIGAIYNHFGKPYRVVGHGPGEVYLDDVEPYLRTEGIFYSTTQTVEVLSGYRYDENLTAYYGKLIVYENFNGFRLIDMRSVEVVEESHSQESRRMSVRGFWFELNDISNLDAEVGINDFCGIEQLLRIGAPFVIPCDRHDFGTGATLKNIPKVFLYEIVPGGTGFGEKMLEVWPEVIKIGINIAKNCKCKNGCPSCLVPPRPSLSSTEFRKKGVVQMGEIFLALAQTSKKERFELDNHAWVPDW